MTIFEYTRVSVPSLMSAVLVLLLTIFILLQYRDLRDRMVRLMGTAEMGRSTQAFDEAKRQPWPLSLAAVGRERDLWGIRRPVAMGNWNSEPDLVGGPDGGLAVRALCRRYSLGRLSDGTCRDDRSFRLPLVLYRGLRGHHVAIKSMREMRPLRVGPDGSPTGAFASATFRPQLYDPDGLME